MCHSLSIRGHSVTSLFLNCIVMLSRDELYISMQYNILNKRYD